jgi:hypothetical protein
VSRGRAPDMLEQGRVEDVAHVGVRQVHRSGHARGHQAAPHGLDPSRPSHPCVHGRDVGRAGLLTGDGVLIPAVPRYVQGPLGTGDVAVGLVVGAFSLSAFFLRPWAGRPGDRWGRRPLMLVGAGMFTASVLGYGLASSPQTLAGLRLLTGAGEAFFFVGAITAVADLAPARRRGEAISLASLALYVGSASGRSSARWPSTGSGTRRRGCSPPPPG